MKKSSLEQFRESHPVGRIGRHEPTPSRRAPKPGGRLTKIRQRAVMMQGEFLQRDEATLTRDLTEDEVEEQRRVGVATGAAWVARARGL